MDTSGPHIHHSQRNTEKVVVDYFDERRRKEKGGTAYDVAWNINFGILF